jgi:sulfite dehydrogenase
MNIKSWINSPFTDGGPVKPGKVQIQGVAFGGLHAVKGVEVSINGGKTWQQARFVGPDLGKYAWRQFVLETLLGSGSYTLASRATDTAGKSQPETRGENLSGYNNNSWADHAFKITVA